ncbi:hypothetical protein MOQ72_27295 [Saccharopolyspora sp. K220]|uniref:hypothetical protein n=1 Tax=Saccharopolyspora soli TaxID=2926618 RepID=UPI001F5712E8|nr:hypothetical protein [Saccharopolyspora soli]MCI2421155.1 hypothetical protein [Saccharopolyspora soli]
MPAFPKTEDVNKVREQAAHALGEAAEQARTPLLAALGAGDVAAHAVVEAVNKIRTQLGERAESARHDLPADFNELRDKFDPAELRKRVDAYSQSAKQLYDYLAERGEETLHRLQDQPQVKKVWDQMGTAQGKVEETVDEVRDLADDVLGKVSRPFGTTAEKPAEEPVKAEEPAAKPAAKTSTETKTAPRKTTTRSTAAKSTAKKSSTSKSSES